MAVQHGPTTASGSLFSFSFEMTTSSNDYNKRKNALKSIDGDDDGSYEK